MFNWILDLTFLKDFFNWAISKVLGFFMSFGYVFLKLIFSLLSPIASLLPNISPLIDMFHDMLDIASPYLTYVLDASFISRALIIYFVSSITIRISVKLGTSIVKWAVNWYHKIVP